MVEQKSRFIEDENATGEQQRGPKENVERAIFHDPEYSLTALSHLFAVPEQLDRPGRRELVSLEVIIHVIIVDAKNLLLRTESPEQAA